MAREWKRGERRAVSITTVLEHITKPFDDICKEVAKACEMDVKTSQGHTRWLAREGYLSDQKEHTDKWPKRVAGEAKPKKEKTPKAAKPAKEKKAKSPKSGKSTEPATTAEPEAPAINTENSVLAGLVAAANQPEAQIPA